MACHDSKLPVSFPDVWSYMRDTARGTTPLAQYYLDCSRQFCPPSKAHRRRLLTKRDRPIITRPPAPLPVDAAPRSYHNEAARLGCEVAQIARSAALLERHYLNGNSPVRAPSTTTERPPVTYGVLKDDAWPSVEAIDARITHLNAQFKAERARVDALLKR